MIDSILGYSIQEKLSESPHADLYRAYPEGKQQTVLLKVSRAKVQGGVQLQQEYETLQNLPWEQVVQVCDFYSPLENFPLIALVDSGGTTLQSWIQKRSLSLEEFLSISIEMAGILGKLHREQWIHLSIHPKHFFWNPETQNLQLMGFEYSTKISRENPKVQLTETNIDTQLLEKGVYLAPEFTDSKYSSLDYRTDYYALGVTFYEILAGNLPSYQQGEYLPPHQWNSEIPPILSQIILKLMASPPEDRYQSAFGLLIDLQRCLKQFQGTKKIYVFPLGERDVSFLFSLSPKLYGREKELQQLKLYLEESCQGKRKGVWISGYSGIGKSRLAKELSTSVSQKGGIFLFGKFEQYKRDLPYFALGQACQELARQIISRGTNEIAHYKLLLQKKIGTNSRLILDTFPEMEFILGQQPPLSPLPLQETKNRFHLVFSQFFSCFATADQPFVLFLDDLQWADHSSLHFLEHLLCNQEIPYFLFVGAYRENEVAESHPLSKLKRKIKSFQSIILRSLSLDDVQQLIIDSFQVHPYQAKPLAELCIKKTQGNPFFCYQFLQTLYQEKLIQLDFTSMLWNWDLEKIQKADLTDNVVELVINKIQKLPEAIQETLKLSACFGKFFAIDGIEAISSIPFLEIKQILQFALTEDFLYQNDDLYHFTHDRVQQSAYSLLQEEERERIHLQIGKWLLEKGQSSKWLEERDNLFEVLYHLNSAKRLLQTEEEKNKLIQLNLQAGIKARVSIAYQLAFSYLEIAYDFLKGGDWEQQYETTLELFRELAQVSYLTGEFEQLEHLIQTGIQYSRSLIHQTFFYEIQLEALKFQGKFLESLHVGAIALRQLGISLPPVQASKFQSRIALFRIRLFLRSKGILRGEWKKRILDLPPMQDPLKLAAMRIMENMVSSCYQTNINLYPSLLLQQIKCSLKYGYSTWSCMPFVSLASLLNGMLEKTNEAYQVGKLSCFLAEHSSAKSVQGRVKHNYAIAIRCWIEPFHVVEPDFLECYHLCLEHGDFEYGSYALLFTLMLPCLQGTPFQEFQDKFPSVIQKLLQIHQQLSASRAQLFYQFTLNLQIPRRYTEPWELTGEICQESDLLTLFQKTKNRTSLCILYLLKLTLAYLFQAYEEAVTYANEAQNYLPSIFFMPFVFQFYYYDSLAQLSIYPDRDRIEQIKILYRVKQNLKRLKHFSQFAPANYLPLLYLIEAERFHVLKKKNKAIRYYELAIAKSKQYHFLQYEALSYERAARFYLAQRQEEIASDYLRESYQSYQKWGANTKVKTLEEQYPKLFKS